MEHTQEEILLLIEDALVVWRTNQTRAKGNVSLNRFADYLGVTRSLLSMWQSQERTVTTDNKKKIAKPIADLVGSRAYEILEVTPPNPLLQALNARWERIPPDKQQKLLELSEQFEIKNDEQRLQEASKQRKKAPRK